MKNYLDDQNRQRKSINDLIKNDKKIPPNGGFFLPTRIENNSEITEV